MGGDRRSGALDFRDLSLQIGDKKRSDFFKSKSLAWMIFLMDELNGKDHAFTATGRFKPNQILSLLKLGGLEVTFFRS